MTTLAQLLGSSRAFEFRTAVVAHLTSAFPQVAVKALPGRLDISDLDRKDLFAPPAFGVAVSRVRPAEGRMSGQRDVPIEVVVYIVVEDQLVDGRLVFRDELGLALCDGLLGFLETPEGRWGLDDIGMPEDAEARAVITVGTEKEGTAYFAATWWQMLFSQGQPFMDMDSQVGPGEPYVLLPGDPGWTPPGLEPAP